jgi:hypothetical protein
MENNKERIWKMCLFRWSTSISPLLFILVERGWLRNQSVTVPRLSIRVEVASSAFVGREFELKGTWLFRKASMSDRNINTANVLDL